MQSTLALMQSTLALMQSTLAPSDMLFEQATDACRVPYQSSVLSVFSLCTEATRTGPIVSAGGIEEH